jgi:hypothetical protein
VSHLRRRREVTVPAQIDAPDPTPDAATQLAARQEQQMVAAALDELPDEAREVLALFYREGESVAQVAGLLDLSEEAVRKRLSRARSRLRAELVGRLGEVLRAGRPGAGFVALAAASAFGSVAEAAGPPVVLAAAGAKAGGLAALVAGLSGAAGVLFGYLYYRRRCVDESQRRALRRLTLANLALVVLLAVLFVPMRRLAPGWGDIGVLLAFLAGMGWINLVELPRRLPITRRDKLLNWLGLAAGLAAVVLVVVTALWFIGHATVVARCGIAIVRSPTTGPPRQRAAQSEHSPFAARGRPRRWSWWSAREERGASFVGRRVGPTA